jgi:hypothetical protein
MTVESATFLNDLNASYPSGSDSKNEGDNHIVLLKSVLKATFPNLTGRTWRSLSAKTSNYSLAATDNMVVVPITSAGVTISTASAAATMGNGFIAILFSATNAFTIDPNGSETVNGAATLAVPANTSAILVCDGSNHAALLLPMVATVPLAGGTMTGLLTLSGDPSTALQAATKQYADTKVAASRITISTTTPTGGSNDDLWIQY